MKISTKLGAFLLILFVFSGVLSAQECRLSAIEGPHATLVVYRYRLFVGSGRRASIYLDEQQVCSLHNGRYLIIEVAPGKHTLRSSDSKHGGVEEDFKEGEITYYRTHVEATNAFQLNDFWVLDPVPSNRAKEELKSLKAQDGEGKALPQDPK